ncbi:MAG: hypothetical protein BGO70_02270 [Bacteroidetes bacterium 43-93]|nr:MAG: hypothetical protein BGO70_02270 [Bacteroidetes bacterium 43-93]
MLRTVEVTYRYIIETDDINVPINHKTFHLNANSGLSGYERKRLANIVNGLIRRYASVKQIDEAKIELKRKGKKLNRVNIANEAGLSLKTVSRNAHLTPVDIAEQILSLNCEVNSGQKDIIEKGTINV